MWKIYACIRNSTGLVLCRSTINPFVCYCTNKTNFEKWMVFQNRDTYRDPEGWAFLAPKYHPKISPQNITPEQRYIYFVTSRQHNQAQKCLQIN